MGERSEPMPAPRAPASATATGTGGAAPDKHGERSEPMPAPRAPASATATGTGGAAPDKHGAAPDKHGERLLTISNLTTGYNDVAVVRHLDLHVDSGEIVALLGANGAGKTTTLLTVSALNPIMSGDIELFGQSVSKHRPHYLSRHGLAHVLESRSLFFQLTVAENLKLGASGGAAHFDRAVGYFPALANILDRRAGLLSGGEQQMLAMARALATNPRLLMVDEMSLGLAPIIVERLMPVLRQVVDDTGAGVLLVEQHVHMALEIADRGYVLSHGDLVMQGTAAELRAEDALLRSSYLGATELAAVED